MSEEISNDKSSFQSPEYQNRPDNIVRSYSEKPQTEKALKVFRGKIQSYWGAQHLYYINKWLKKSADELELAQENTSLPTAEYIIVKFLMNAVTTGHPGIVKMLMEMSGGKQSFDVDKEEKEEAVKTIKRVILELPKSKRIDESK